MTLVLPSLAMASTQVSALLGPLPPSVSIASAPAENAPLGDTLGTLRPAFRGSAAIGVSASHAASPWDDPHKIALHATTLTTKAAAEECSPLVPYRGRFVA